MGQYKVDIIDREGWRREFQLEKAIAHIGSDPRNDIVLESGRGGGVAPLHAQLIVSSSNSGCQLVNLGNADILLGSSGDRSLSPRSATNVVDGATFRLGEFTLVFHGGEHFTGEFAAGDFAGSSQHIGLSVSLPRTRLEPNRTLDGVVTVRNLGELVSAQINLELEGLESACYDVEPGPILPAGAEQAVSFHLYHRGNKPLAGDYPISIHATAPTAYPGEQATVSRVVHVLPFYRHRLHLVSPAEIGRSRRADERPAPTSPAAERPPRAGAGRPSPAEDWWAPTPSVATERAPQAEAAARPQVEAAERASPARMGTRPPARKWWARLVQKVKADLPARAAEEEGAIEAEAVPPAPVEGEPALEEAEAGPRPREKKEEEEERPAARIEAGLPAQVEEKVEEVVTPEAEPISPALREDERGPEVEAGSPVQVQVEKEAPEIEAVAPAPAEDEGKREVEAGLPVRVDGEETPEAEAVAPASPEDEREPKAEVGPRPRAEERPAAHIEVPAPAAEEERAPEATVGPEEPAGRQWARRPKASRQPEAKAERTAATSPAEDWWAPEAPARPVIKLKASRPPEAEVEPAPTEAGPPPPAEAWWTAEAEAGLEELPEKRRVLKLKAGQPPETEAEKALKAKAGRPAPDEDWWAAEAE